MKSVGFLLLLILTEVRGTGKLILDLVRYESDGIADNGNCCDSFSSWCSSFSYCDFYFDLCFDRPTGGADVTQCSVGKVRTGTIWNQHEIDFENDIGGVANPMTYNFTRWPGNAVKLKVDVWDEDGDSDEFVEYLNKNIQMTPAASYGQSYQKRVTLQGRTKLVVKVRAYCNPDYYGPFCDVHCVPRDSNFLGYYDCGPNGERQCHPGWGGPNCNEDLDNCLSSPCYNGGSCEDAEGTFYCTCPPGITGTRCETVTGACISGPCLHGGTCRNVGQTYQCECPPFYTGVNCQIFEDPCDPEPCQHGGSCAIDGDVYRCQCQAGYTGYHCETDVDECSSAPCLHAGSCTDSVDSYTCSCAHGYTGSQCQTDIDECAGVSCQNGGQCLDGVGHYTCRCSPGFTGSLCETDVDECSSAPCLHAGSCTDSVDSYTCSGARDYTGSRCHIYILTVLYIGLVYYAH